MHENVLSFYGHLIDCLRACLSNYILSQVGWIDNLTSLLGQLLIWYDRYDVG